MKRVATDGACSGNPGPGGWAAVIYNENETEPEDSVSGGCPLSTNNRMELVAAIAGLKKVAPRSKVLIESDSQYVVHGITRWFPGWARNGRLTGEGCIKNADLWVQLNAARNLHSEVTFRWVRGHNGHPGNELADAIARAEVKKFN